MSFGTIAVAICVVWIVCMCIYSLKKKRFDKPVRRSYPSDAIVAQFGYMVVEDVTPTIFKVSDLELVYFLEPFERDIGGEEMCKRAADLKANLGLVDAMNVLDQQAEIPLEFRGKFLVFTGTRLCRHLDGPTRIVVLRWSGFSWAINVCWLDDDWGSGDCLVRYTPKNLVPVKGE